MSLSKDEIQLRIKLLNQVFEQLQCEIEPLRTNTKDNKSNFNLDAINWLNKDRALVDIHWAWTFVFNRGDDIHPEIESIYEVCRYGEIHIDDRIITAFGTRSNILAKCKLMDG